VQLLLLPRLRLRLLLLVELRLQLWQSLWQLWWLPQRLLQLFLFWLLVLRMGLLCPC
jgi:hypothetical protein